MSVYVLLDTADFSDAILTGRDTVEDLSFGEPGLRITYDEGRKHPSITVCGPDGEVVFSGLSEIVQATRAINSGCRAAERDCKQNEAGD